MNYGNPRLRDALASEYVLGTLHGGARRRFEALMRRDHELRILVERWEQRLMPLGTALPAVEPSKDLLASIERQIKASVESGLQPKSFADAQHPETRSVARPAKRSSRTNKWAEFFERFFGIFPMGALAAGLMIGLIAPRLYQMAVAPEPALLTQIPDSYVGVLADRNGKPGIAVSSLRHGKLADIKQLQSVNVPAESSLVLWKIDKSGRATALMRLENKRFSSAIMSDTSERLMADAVELGVSIESNSSTFAAEPSGGFLFRGLCGKFWR